MHTLRTRRLCCCLLPLAFAMLQACTNITGSSLQSQIAAQAASAAIAAADFERADHRFDALQQWLLVDALQPDHPHARARINTLQSELTQQAEHLVAEATAAQKKRHYKTARKLLLSALAAQPNNQTVRQMLATQESDRQLRILAKSASKAVSPMRAADAKALTQSSIPRDAQLRRAEAIYQQAVDQLDTNLGEAKKLLQEVLRIEPTHLGARAYLDTLR